MLTLKVKYLRSVISLEQKDGCDWIDLRAGETISLSKGDFKIIPLGVAIQLPEGYEAHIVPRSSTFKRFGIIQTNGVGIIDESYCGDDDEWGMPVLATKDVVIEKDTRICQFRVMLKQPDLRFWDVPSLDNVNRGGFGSTGID